MKKILNYIRLLTPYLGALLLAKFLSIALMMYLPNRSIEKNISSGLNIDFKNYKIDEAFGFKTKQQDEVMQTNGPSYDLKDLILQAIYKKDDGGFIVVIDTTSKESMVLAKQETYKEYKLMQIFSKHVIFSKNGTNYTLKLFGEDPDDHIKVIPTIKKDALSIPKSELLKYTTDLDSIWKNIALKEIKKENEITGFEVQYVRLKSIFGNLGLQTGDIITKVNGDAITSYAQAFKIYNDIGSYDYLEITVMRNGKEKDLGYEIK